MTSTIPLSASPRVVPFLVRNVAIVFFGFLAVGAPLPVLALFVHDTLGFGATTVGWIVGIQSIAAVFSRHRAGTLADSRGPRQALLLGLPVAALAGLFYLAAALAPWSPEARLALLVPGRLILGLGESLFLTGAMSLGIGTLGPQRAGTVMSWQGIAMYAALGLGAPLGLALHAAAGFAGVAVLAIATPLVVLPLAFAAKDVPGSSGERVPFYRVVSLIWRQGLVLALATIPFAAMATFLVLAYAARDWSGAGAALAAFGAGYVAVRLVGSHLPDRFGGARTAGWSLAIEAVGQAMLWLAPNPAVALAGALLTGIGFSLIFPSMGVDATRRVSPELRGRAVGNFTAFFDIAIGLTGPLVGLLVGPLGFQSAFLVGALATLAAIGLLLADGRRASA